MALNYKRIGLVLGFVIVVVGIGLAIYFVFFRNVFGPAVNGNDNTNRVTFPLGNENRNVTTNGNGNVNALPNINGSTPRPIADGGLTTTVPVADTITGGATVAGNGRDLLFYDPITGQFYQISPDGRTKTLLTPDAYKGADKITWSPLRDKAIIEFPDDSKYLYDFKNKQQYTLAPEMTDISFSPGSDKISFKFIGEDPNDRFLVISNPDGSGFRSLEPLGNKANQFVPDWSPAGNVVGTFFESVDADRQRVVPIGQLGENFSAFTVSGRGFQSEWGPGGDKLLYSVFSKQSSYNPTLYITDGGTDSIGSNTVNLDLQTWPSKCSFNGSATSLFCAVPQYLEQGTGLFPESANGIPDDFYRIDLATGKKTLIARPVGANGLTQFSASQLFLSADETLLYFYDKNSGKIQKIQLK